MNTPTSDYTREQLIEFMKGLQYGVKIEQRTKGRSVVTFTEDHGVFKGQTSYRLTWHEITPLALANIITAEGYMKNEINKAIWKTFKAKNLVKEWSAVCAPGH